MVISFIDGCCILTSPLSTHFAVSDENYIDVGLHACLTKKAVRSFLERSLHHSDYFSYHYAIIPKGAEYYIGKCNTLDIVSDKLIIFETEEDYKKYKKSNSLV